MICTDLLSCSLSSSPSQVASVPSWNAVRCSITLINTIPGVVLTNICLTSYTPSISFVLSRHPGIYYIRFLSLNAFWNKRTLSQLDTKGCHVLQCQRLQNVTKHRYLTNWDENRCMDGGFGTSGSNWITKDATSSRCFILGANSVSVQVNIGKRAPGNANAGAKC